MTKKRFTSERTEDYNFSDIFDNGKWIGICHIDSADDFVRKFNELSEENEQLKQSVNNLKETILKITIAYQRKHDNTIVNLVDEVHEEDITDLIKELKE